jgi:hypothetical protein
VANVTVFEPTSGGWVTLWPTNVEYPGTFTTAFMAGGTRANHAILPLAAGWLTGEAFLSGGGTVHLIIDVSGYFD